jgi:hypothetical protein
MQIKQRKLNICTWIDNIITRTQLDFFIWWNVFVEFNCNDSIGGLNFFQWQVDLVSPLTISLVVPCRTLFSFRTFARRRQTNSEHPDRSNLGDLVVREMKYIKLFLNCDDHAHSAELVSVMLSSSSALPANQTVRRSHSSDVVVIVHMIFDDDLAWPWLIIKYIYSTMYLYYYIYINMLEYA